VKNQDPISRKFSLRSGKDRWFLLLVILGFQAFVGAYLWQSTQLPQVTLGFLSERQGHFVLAWKEGNTEMQTLEYPTLEGALAFASDHLRLTFGHNFHPGSSPENVWIQDRFGNPVVFWKTEASEKLFQMTFQSKTDAVYFARAFRQGAYTPSLIGHAIYLVPTSAH